MQTPTYWTGQQIQPGDWVRVCRLGDIAFHRLQKPLFQDVT
jgi:hypothetical protein